MSALETRSSGVSPFTSPFLKPQYLRYIMIPTDICLGLGGTYPLLGLAYCPLFYKKHTDFWHLLDSCSKTFWCKSFGIHKSDSWIICTYVNRHGFEVTWSINQFVLLSWHHMRSTVTLQIALDTFFKKMRFNTYKAEQLLSNNWLHGSNTWPIYIIFSI